MQTTLTRRVVHDPEIMGGEPTIAGTRVPVASIIITYRSAGSLQQVYSAYPHLDADAIVQAFAYYSDHREEIDAYIVEHLDESPWPDELVR